MTSVDNSSFCLTFPQKNQHRLEIKQKKKKKNNKNKTQTSKGPFSYLPAVAKSSEAGNDHKGF